MAAQTETPPCYHWLYSKCQMTATYNKCCSCYDKRPLSTSGLYATYIDGEGSVDRAARWAHYCPGCKNYFGSENGDQSPDVQTPHSKASHPRCIRGPDYEAERLERQDRLIAILRAKRQGKVTDTINVSPNIPITQPEFCPRAAFLDKKDPAPEDAHSSASTDSFFHISSSDTADDRQHIPDSKELHPRADVSEQLERRRRNADQREHQERRWKEKSAVQIAKAQRSSSLWSKLFGKGKGRPS